MHALKIDRGAPVKAMKIAYFVHDLTDAAVLRRVRMLRRGGAEVVVLGFRRTAEKPEEIAGAPVVDLGRTFDGRLKQRALAVARQALASPRLAGLLKGCDVVLARNLEMLTLAALATAMRRPRARLVYECLDIHRVMLGQAWPSRLLRLFESRLIDRCQLLITSSPAFERFYFSPLQGIGGAGRPRLICVENKILEPEEAAEPTASVRRAVGPPWRIGWFGMLRCRKSLEMLGRIAGASGGQVEVVISGRPSPHEFDDFEAAVGAMPGVSFTGAYTAADLSTMYRSVHFVWAIDYFEEGANSDWLLPNRIYEGCRYGAVPVALEGVETGRWLAERGLGLRLSDPVNDMAGLLSALDAPAYRELERRSQDAPRSWFAVGRDECKALVQTLGGDS